MFEKQECLCLNTDLEHKVPQFVVHRKKNQG